MAEFHRKIHMSTSIDGLLAMSDYRLKKMCNCITCEDGTHPTLAMLKAGLRVEKAMGHKLIPATGCDNFDPVKGCLGHAIKEADNEC